MRLKHKKKENKMNKLMITIAAVACAASVNAAALMWGARNIIIPVATDTSVSQSGIVMSSGTKFDAAALTVALFWVDNSGDKISIGSYTTTGSGLITSQTLGDSSSNKTLYNAMLAEGDDYYPSYYFTATYKTATGTYAYEGTATATTPIGNLPSSNIGVTANFANAGSWTYTAGSAVPEPTSGLLMLLGMAGLALRRRRA